MALQVLAKPSGRAFPATGVVAVFSSGRTLVALPASVARAAEPHLRRVGFKGEAFETCTVPLDGQSRQTLVVVGLGRETGLKAFRRGVAAAVQYAKAEGMPAVSVLPPPLAARRGSGVEANEGYVKAAVELGRALAEGALLANYRFTVYSASAARRERILRLKRVELLVERRVVSEVRRGIRRGILEVNGVILARNLVNEPASRVTPQALVEQAQALVRASNGAVRLTVWNRKECAEQGMQAFLAVAQGSSQEPAFLHLTYAPGNQSPLPRIALVGKGITFDSGGLSLKPAESMETMKIDMAGAASVLGVFSVLPRLKLPLEVHGFVAACENMPSGTAMKPGDIVRSSASKTIEILNTDAEGRLVVAEALAQAVKARPQVIVDLATLTGACVVALGEEIAGLWSNDEKTAQGLLRAAGAAGEDLWRLPLVREYREHLKSPVADLKNVTGKRWGGAITAALFLQEFVGEVPWAHLDIAGPSYAEKLVNPLHPSGATGFGVRTLVRYLESVAGETPVA